MTYDKPANLRIASTKEQVEVGYLYRFSYKVEGSSDELVVSTTRPETMLGDTAVAVCSTDPRYLHLIGRHVRHPFTNALIPVIADDILVDPTLGSGTCGWVDVCVSV